ncbi:MFS transporter [Paenibacillus tarimensis]|uniref:MFS transporter n=1 Tax=Paenibacillus tarimensis TaxID=416012 RepID=UPI001F3E21B0|nr:MFS transporter [Paenibacillus tarimensis]MCF2944814.1 MFS transporter [Paenibacillus tarimensis]
MMTKSSPYGRPASAVIEEPPIATTRADHTFFWIVTLLYWITLYVYMPILTPYLEFRGLSMQLIGLVLGSYGFTQILVRLPLGIWSDRLRRRKPFIMLGMLTGAASCFLFIIPGSAVWPLAGRVMAGICASTWVAFTVLYAGYFRSQDATKAMGTISFMTVSGQLAGMAVSGYLAELYGWEAPFAAGIGIGLAGLAAAFAIKEPSNGINSRRPITLGEMRGVVREGILLRVSILSILAHCVLFITMFGFTPLKATTDLGASKADLTLIVAAFMIPHAFTSLVSTKWFAPRYGSWSILAAGFLLSGLFTAAVAWSPSLPVLMATQAFNGFAQGLHLPILLGMAIQDVTQSKRATAMGFYQAMYAAGMFAGPFLAGWLNGLAGIDSGFYFGAAAAAAGAVLAWRWRTAHN